MQNYIESKQRDGDESGNWKLVDTDGLPVPVGTVLTSSDDRTFKATGGRPPQHEASTGRVSGEWLATEATGEYFPHVFNLKWIRIDEPANVSEPVAVTPLAPAEVLAAALRDMVRELVAAQVSELARAAIDDLVEAGHFKAMANYGDFDDAIDSRIEEQLEDQRVLTSDNFDLSDHLDISDYSDEIREVVDLEADVETALGNLLRDDALVVRLDR